MAPLEHVPIAALPPERFRELLGARWAEVETAIVQARELLSGRVVWHVNSTARGGGVVELLTSLLAYARGAGIDVRWAVIGGDPSFFAITKRIHNNLHGNPGDGGPLGEEERRHYEEVQAVGAAELVELVRPGDVVYLHDPQTAGMAAAMKAAGATVLWRCHVGLDVPNEIARTAWNFLRPYVEPADAHVFSREAFVWEGLARERIAVIAPSIDIFSPKNQELEEEVVTAIIERIGLAADRGRHAVFRRHDGSRGRVDRPATVVQDAPLPPAAPLLAQISRWDRLKDPVGVLNGFADGVADPDAHLLLAGPDVEEVSDDPEGAEVLAEVRAARQELAAEIRARVHLASLPMEDPEENAVMVNAIQRRATVIAQKSIAEGFGLTATEAMWKSRPVIVTGVGGLQEQVVDGVSGRVIEDPHDLAAFGAAAAELLGDTELAARMGAAARERVSDRYLGTRHLVEYVELLGRMLRDGPGP